MPITKYEGQTFKSRVFQLEECWFVNCVLRECTIFFAGGPYELANTTFDNCQWKFQGNAALTLGLLTQIGLIPPGQKPPAQIQTPKMTN